MPKRSPALPPLSSKERATLDPSFYPNVDAFLKCLKPLHRRFHAALITIQNEGQVLERLFYKGKNQHRSTLFWRRLSGLRRFSRRVDELMPVQTVTALCRCFFAEKETALFKGAWNRLPDEHSFVRVLDRLKMLKAFFETLSARSMEAYRNFSLAMQSGAFLQLLLSLIAIASRFGYLSQDLSSILDDMIMQIQQLQAALSMRHQSVRPLPVAQEGDESMEKLRAKDHQQSTRNRLLEGTSSSSKEGLTDPSSRASPEGVSKFPVAEQRSPDDSALAVKSSKPKLKSARPPHQRKAKKKLKRDEIDDVFGF